MLLSKHKIKRIVGLLAIYFTCDLSFSSVLNHTHAKQAKNQQESETVNYEGLPSNRRGGGSRGNCMANGEDFIALVPDRAVNKTASISPQLFFYVPQISGHKNIEFVLRNREDRLVYKTLLKTTDRAGIMSVALPEHKKEHSREYYGDYHWYLSLICNSKRRSQDIVLEGWIEYVELNNTEKERRLS